MQKVAVLLAKQRLEPTFLTQMHLRVSLLAWTLAGSLLGCAGAGREPQPRQDMGAVVPAEGWKSEAMAGEVGDGWIASFGEPRLVELVAEALRNNPDIQAAAANLEAAQAGARRAGAALLPSVGLNLGGNRNVPLEGMESASLGASLDVGWEVDLWGRVASARRGAKEQFLASAAEVAFARQSLAAQTVKSWFLATEAKMQLDLAREFAANYADSLRIVQARYDAGAVTQQDVANAQADAAASRQAVQQGEVAFREALRSLEVLIGRYPSAEIAVADALQVVPPPIPAGLPSELLERRPDIVAAEREVAAAFQFSKAAAAARLPRIALTGSLGSTSNALSSLINPVSAATAFGASLFQPLFDGGLRQAEFDQAKASQKAAVARYRSVALRAFQEVENALDREASLRLQEESLLQAAQNYEKARRIAETRYQEGAVPLTDVLLTRRQELQARTGLIRVRGERLAQRVNLHLALGGNFAAGTIDLQPKPTL
jgi:NodT family efflux transporter outer membrane factor (OMF) lipoprotein